MAKGMDTNFYGYKLTSLNSLGDRRGLRITE